MSNEPRTPEQWLACGDDLPLELAKVLAPKPWKHSHVIDDDEKYCGKCGFSDSQQQPYCSVPDPIKIDWNTAMKWRDEACCTATGLELVYQAMVDICEEEPIDYLTDDNGFDMWLFKIAQPKHYLIVAAMAAEGATE